MKIFQTSILILGLVIFVNSQTGQPRIYHKTPATGHRISGGVIMNPEGQPVAKADIEIRDIGQRAAGTQLFSRRTQTDERGRWTIDKVPDGDYLLVVNSGSRLARGKDGWFKELDSKPATEFVARTYEVKMSGTDIDNFAIQVIKGGRITGKIIMEGGEPIPEGLVVLPEQTAKTGGSPGRMAPVQPDGSFILEGVPVDDIFFKVFVFGKVKEFYTKSATVGSVDLLRETLKIEDGTEVKDVYIIFAKAMKK